MSKIIPTTITAGVTFERTAALDSYPPGDGWVASLALRGPSVINVTGVEEAGKHSLAAAAAVTATWVAGRYSYSVRVTKGAEVFEVEAGAVKILVNIGAQTSGFDGRSHAETVLDSIEAVIEKRATLDQERYRINNRELYRTPIAELLKLRDTYRAEVQQERMKASGNYSGRSVRVIL